MDHDNATPKALYEAFKEVARKEPELLLPVIGGIAVIASRPLIRRRYRKAGAPPWGQKLAVEVITSIALVRLDLMARKS